MCSSEMREWLEYASTSTIMREVRRVWEGSFFICVGRGVSNRCVQWRYAMRCARPTELLRRTRKVFSYGLVVKKMDLLCEHAPFELSGWQHSRSLWGRMRARDA